MQILDSISFRFSDHYRHERVKIPTYDMNKNVQPNVIMPLQKEIDDVWYGFIGSLWAWVFYGQSKEI